MSHLKGLFRAWSSQVGRGPLLWLILLVLCLVVFLSGLGSPGLYDPHESRNAETAREMLVRGDWLTPHVNFARFLDKPPLSYWLIGLSYLVFGVSEFAARLPIAMAAVGGVLVTWAIGRDLFGDRAGFFAAVILLTSIGYFVLGRQVLPDPVFSCFTTLSFCCFLRNFLGYRYSKLYSLLFSSSIALAIMTKGLLGLFPLFVIGLYLLLIGRLRHFRHMTPVWGGLLFVTLTMPWHLVMGWQNEGFFWYYFMNEQFLRFLGRRDPIDYISLPLPVFLLILFLWLVPWSTYLPLAVLTNPLRRRKNLDRAEQGGLLIWLWAAAILGFFSLSQARLHQYLLPAMPALGLLIGKSLNDRLTGKIPSAKGLVMLSVLSLLLLALGFFLVPVYIGRYYDVGPPEQTASLSRAFFITLMTGSGLAALAFSQRRWTVGIPSLVCSMLAVFFVAHQGLVLLESSQSSKLLAAFINRGRQPGETIVLEAEKDGPFEYAEVAGLVFYTGQKVYLLRKRNPPKFPLPLQPGEHFILSEAEFHRLWGSEEQIYLVTDAFGEGESILDHQSPFVVVGHVGDRWVLSNKALSHTSNAKPRPSGQPFTAAVP
jgi:4-amino-4-deoxy-L-arabinose transferase-like glycosyltransferase